ALGVGIGAVLQQNGHPIAYISKTLSLKHQSLSKYEKEFLAVLLALEKWRGYLLDRHFIIRTDHFSLKYLLDQKITTLTQMKWLPKLMGFDYKVVYKKGSENGAADVLLRVQTSELFSMITILVSTDLAKKIKDKGLPKSYGKDVILVVVDRLNKYAHFIALSHPFTAHQVAQALLDNVSTAYHPQTDGQTKVVNRCLEGYLRCMTGEHPREWIKWMSLAELWYNSNFHIATQSTPFEIVYGVPPPIHVIYFGGLSKVEAVDRTLKAKEEAI
ncbi:reverse transcriptase, partial [Tanacetum coccineum]